ncbi:MAG TPA: PEGA domain-containing protein [Candidatus Nitrosopolaris sp.]|nr:PEGA domain-containing protein [Candidatus Nitrosopolaris sp.]
MDFLDPKKKRNYKIRLIIGYVLVAIALVLATVVLVYGAYGYSINTKTGSVIQNGLLFVDSKPGGATIYLNSQRHGTTSARLVLPSGNYTLKLTKTGYRNWQRSISLEAQTIDRFVYPFLFPTKPRVTNLKTYVSVPPLVTETPDRHWLLVQLPNSDPSVVSFDQFDTSKLDQTQSPTVVNLPAGILTNTDLPDNSLTEVAWSTDNSHLLLKHGYQGGSEFIVFNRSVPSDSFNVNKALKINPTDVELRNDSVSQLYIYDAAAESLSVADTTKDVVDKPFLTHVLAFKGYGTSLITYVTDNKMPAGQVQARIWDNGPTYALATLAAGDHYLIDAAQYQSDWYYVAGSSGNDHIFLYKNPLSSLTAGDKALSFISLRVAGADQVGFSANTRFVEAESGQQFGVYDFETMTRYQYTVQAALAGPMHWMDGHRLIGASNGQVFVMDYDGTNQQSLTITDFALGGYFSNDYNHLLTTAPASDGTSVILQNVDMRAGADLPPAPSSGS